MKRILSIALLVSLMGSLVLLAASCGGETVSTQEKNDANEGPTAENGGEAAETPTEESFDPGLPDMDFGGAEFRILNLDQESMWWAISDLDMDIDSIDKVGTALSDPVVNDAIYKRNRTLEEKYNFVVKETRTSSAQVASILKNSVNAGGDDYDLVSPHTQTAPSMATSNQLVDLNKVPYLNFDKPWWNNSVSHYFAMGNRLFFTCSDFTISDKDNVAVFMYNKKLAEILGIDGAESLYGLVEEGKWTYGKFIELCKAAPADLNGDGVIKGPDDRYGLSCCGWLYTYLLAGFDETVIKKDADDLPYIAAKSERFAEAYAAMVDFLFLREVVVREYTDTPNLRTEEMFVNDKALFCAQVLACVRLYKNMGSDFALLPFPKYDEAQPTYCTPALGSQCLVIPTTNPNLEQTGFILEAMSAESRKVVIPAYYEISIGTKYLRDDISVKMLDIILQNRIYDINDSMYNWGNFPGAFSAAASKGDKNFASLLEKNETKLEAAMQKTIDAFNDID
ncbi:MAG: extracellular solute-binding protein [Oscillospiraceae bacterium]|nr:extracellular solute-binding protein [Oscillospiraceae bacterium]